MQERIGYTTGVFDLFHIGHLNLLRNARALCDVLVVGVTTDEMCLQRKNKLPIIPQSERMELVASIRYVDRAVPQTTADKMNAWRSHHFDVMFVGDDWKGTEAWTQLEREFAPVGVDIVYLPYTTHTSSSILRQVLEKGLGRGQ